MISVSNLLCRKSAKSAKLYDFREPRSAAGVDVFIDSYYYLFKLVAKFKLKISASYTYSQALVKLPTVDSPRLQLAPV